MTVEQDDTSCRIFQRMGTLWELLSLPCWWQEEQGTPHFLNNEVSPTIEQLF